jgi:hypothetical protein
MGAWEREFVVAILALSEGKKPVEEAEPGKGIKWRMFSDR